MSPVALALVLGAAVAHATWNLAAKRAGRGGTAFVWLSSATGVVVWAPLGLGVLVLTRARFDLVAVLVTVVSASIHVGYFVLLQRGYRAGDLSVVYPLARGTGPLLSVTLAVLVFAERPGWLALAGAAAVVAGIFVVGLGRPAGTPTGHRLAAGVGYGVATGVMIAMYTLWDAHAVTALALSPIVYDWGNELFRTALLTPYAARRFDRVREIWRAHRLEVIVVGVLSPLAYILVLIAYTMADVSLVAPARESSIVIGTLFGWLLLHESQPGRRLFGALIVVAGIAALAAA